MKGTVIFTFLFLVFLTFIPVQAYHQSSQNQLAEIVLSEAVEVQEAIVASEREDTDALLEEVRQLLQYHHIDQPGAAILQHNSIDEILEALGDPYTSYLTPEEEQALLDSLNLNYAGIGMVITQIDDYPVVDRVFPDSPAEKSGIGKGDTILQVDDLLTKGVTTDLVASQVRGPEGTSVTMRLNNSRTGEPYELTMTRERISIPQAEGEIVGESIGYIRLYSFGEQAGEDFANVYNDLIEQGMEKLLLDLRGNGGGSMTAAQSIGDFLLPEGTLYYLIYNDGDKSIFRTEGSETILPMAVLIDHHTASAAELLSAALQERSQALLIGSNSFGKGSVQSLFPLESGGVLKATIARYQSPQGRMIDQVGLAPDLPVSTRSLQLLRAKEVLEPPTQRELRLYLDRPEAVLSGKEFFIEQAPMIREDRAYLPLRFLIEALGGVASHDEDREEALVLFQGRSLTLSLQSLPVQEDRAFAPLRLISEELGYQVEYKEENREIVVILP
ncbi:S41 family peptidase [Heliorestis convoluta]|uniref:PDZ domain-containing protein n=1 Tax=Heliorestis convoluta TaxID=356322 RepID=A0A5Q2N353_9FIRM|nr:S41 family peptidase [Heliorestis convoluta]QGG47722.1 PDZ domain-containing protein [Heliorestis convoluta]